MPFFGWVHLVVSRLSFVIVILFRPTSSFVKVLMVDVVDAVDAVDVVVVDSIPFDSIQFNSCLMGLVVLWWFVVQSSSNYDLLPMSSFHFGLHGSDQRQQVSFLLSPKHP
jgi:hypothetical protein